jgi:hypothetical protein
MTRYVARFMKNVLGENGHEAEICQRSIEIDAPCVNVRDWLLHADRVHVIDAEFPS